MSSTTMYVVESDGSLSEFTEYRNAYGSGPQVWALLSHKHIDNVADPRAKPGSFTPHKRHWAMDKGLVTELYAIANDCARGESDKMQPYEWRTMHAVADYVVLKIELLDVYADALQKFADEYASACEGQAFSIGKQANDLREVKARAADEGWRGVCWQQNSTTDVFGSGEMTEARCGDQMLSKLGETSLSSEQRAEVLAALADWQPEEPYCEYNVDIDTRHTWLDA